MIDIRKAQVAGHAALREARATADSATAGHPRVGSAGCVGTDGEVYGVCPRIALARQLGIQETPSLATQIMWKAGEANEDTWNKVLDAGLPSGIKRQTGGVEICEYIEGVTLPVLGHPDVIYGDEHSYTSGLELKGVFGASTATLVALDGRPKNDNLIQAAAYSHFMAKLPWALCYTSPSWFPVNFYDQKSYGVKSIPPFYRNFYLEWHDDSLSYHRDDDVSIPTVITGKGIEDYYRLVEEMRLQKDLGPRPSSHYVCGKQNKWGRESMCGLCPFKAACDRYDTHKNYDNWVDDIKQSTEEAAA